MGQCDHLVMPGEDNVMLADDSTAPYSVHTYLVLVTGLADVMPVVYEVIFAAKLLVYSLGNHYRRSRVRPF